MVSMTYRRTKKWCFCSEPFTIRRHIMKKTLNIFLIAALLIPFTFSPASAGPRNNHLLETFIIGTGVAILGTALIHEVQHNNRRNDYAHNNYSSRKYPKYPGWQKTQPIQPRGYRHQEPRHPEKRHAWNGHKSRGNWVIEKMWITPIYENRWVPGHHKKQGRWMKGRYRQVIAQKGYWEKRRVWIRSDR